MNSKIHLNLSITELLTAKILNAVVKNNDLTKIQYLKCKLGLEMLLINLSKMCVMYTLAVIVQMPVEVFVFHMAFLTIRVFAYGAHSYSSILCTVLSCLILVGIPAFLIHGYLLPKTVLCIISGLNFFLIYKYAPGATRKNPIGDIHKKRRLRNKALTANAILIMIMFISPSLLCSNLVIIGALTATSLLLPGAHKLLGK